MNSCTCTSLSSVIPIQVPWDHSVGSLSWRQMRRSFIQGNKQLLRQRESLNHGYLEEKHNSEARNVEIRGEATLCVEK